MNIKTHKRSFSFVNIFFFTICILVGKDLLVLLSNDKHLCSKAIISDIKAFNAEVHITLGTIRAVAMTAAMTG